MVNSAGVSCSAVMCWCKLMRALESDILVFIAVSLQTVW